MPRRDKSAAEVVTIYWRDIPAQVNGQRGRERHQLLLSSKFQRAVDRAKRKAGIYTAEEDIAQWRRVSVACDDHVLAAEAQAAALEAEYSKEYLGKLAYAGGDGQLIVDNPYVGATLWLDSSEAERPVRTAGDLGMTF